MGKRAREAADSTIDDFFGLEPAQKDEEVEPERSGKTVSVGVHMSMDMRDEYDRVAAQNRLSRSMLMRYVLGWWLREYGASRVQIEFEETRVPKLEG